MSFSFLRRAVGTYQAPPRFKVERETPEVEPLPRVSSTWSLVAAKVHTDEDTVDEGEQGVQEPPATAAQVVVSNPQGLSELPIQVREHSPQARIKSSRFKRAVKKVKKFLNSESVSDL